MTLCPPGNQPAADIVYTPRDVATRIIGNFPLTGIVLDPSRGKGAFHDSFPDHVTKKWCEIEEGQDFFDFHERVDWIMTNPPWSKIREFLRHGMRIADNIVYLSLFNHFVTRRRLQDINDMGFGIREFHGIDNPPKPWPSSGFQLVACWIQRGWTGPVTFSGTISFGEAK